MSERVLEETYAIGGSEPRIEIVIRGPQGSGKSTLAMGLLAAMNDEDNGHLSLFATLNDGRRVPIYAEQANV